MSRLRARNKHQESVNKKADAHHRKRKADERRKNKYRKLRKNHRS